MTCFGPTAAPSPVRILSKGVRSAKARSWSTWVLLSVAGAASLGLMGCERRVDPVLQKPNYPIIQPANLAPYLQGTFEDQAILNNIEPQNVSSYGLVGQLRATGDSTASTLVRQYMLKEITIRYLAAGARTGESGTAKPLAGDILRDPSFAIVRVDAWVPPGARKDDWIDAYISCLPRNNTTSLVGGRLYETDLKYSGADLDNPAGAVNSFVRVAGPIAVNPVYAIANPKTASTPARAGLREGTVMYSAQVMQDRPIRLQLRQPSLPRARQMQQIIQTRFQSEGEEKVAQALDEGIIEVLVPKRYRGDWQHFGEVLLHLFLRQDAGFSNNQARILAEVAVKPEGTPEKMDEKLRDISYCWEGMGQAAMPHIRSLINHPDAYVSFYAARAAAFIENSDVAAQRLMQIARRKDHPFRMMAVRTLGKLPSSHALNGLLRNLLDADQAQLRIEAYQILARNRDVSVNSIYVAPAANPKDQQFILDIVPGDGPPLVYASRKGPPRIAILGRVPDLSLPIPFTTLDNRLTFSRDPAQTSIQMFYRDARLNTPVRVKTQPDLGAVIACLGGMSNPDDPTLNFSFGEVAGIVQALVSQNKLVARDLAGRTVLASFLFGEPDRVREDIARAPLAGIGGAAPRDFGAPVNVPVKTSPDPASPAPASPTTEKPLVSPAPAANAERPPPAPVKPPAATNGPSKIPDF